LDEWYHNSKDYEFLIWRLQLIHFVFLNNLFSSPHPLIHLLIRIFFLKNMKKLVYPYLQISGTYFLNSFLFNDLLNVKFNFFINHYFFLIIFYFIQSLIIYLVFSFLFFLIFLLVIFLSLIIHSNFFIFFQFLYLSFLQFTVHLFYLSSFIKLLFIGVSCNFNHILKQNIHFRDIHYF